jgi:hypothetical protein
MWSTSSARARSSRSFLWAWRDWYGAWAPQLAGTHRIFKMPTHFVASELHK